MAKQQSSLWFFLAALAPAAAGAQMDTVAMRKEMRRTADAYESALRSKAPHRMVRAAFCDENVGRYCIVYDVGTGGPLPPEAEGVKQARAKAIDAFRRGVEAWPADSTIVAPLVRYLIDDHRGADAVTVAREFAERSSDPDWAQLLIGMALHATGDDAAAESVFARTLPKVLPTERMQLHDVLPLLTREEQTRYQGLAGPERARYHEQLWRLADPLYLTDGNETLVEHFSRNIYGRILAYSADDAGWGPDVAVLTLRFGVPTARSQSFGQGVGGMRITEHYDPNQLTYVPPAMITKNGLNQFEPGGIWPYDTIRSRSGYAPKSIRRMLVMEHQVARYPGHTRGELRADYLIPIDSAVTLPANFAVALFALDADHQIVGEVRDTVVVAGRGTTGSLSMLLPPRTVAYSLEAIDLGSRLAARARYALPVRSAGPSLSDLTIVAASEAPPPASRTASEFKPLPTLLIPQGDAIALYLEVQGLTPDANREVSYSVDLEVLEQSSPGTFSGVVRRLGRALGMGGDDVAPRITWNQQQNATETTVIALKLGRIQLNPGVKQFKLTLTDTRKGTTASIARLVRISFTGQTRRIPPTA